MIIVVNIEVLILVSYDAIKASFLFTVQCRVL